MAVTASLVHQGHNRLRYLISGTSGTATITSTGAASPDLLTDTLAGALKNLALAFTNGFGKLPAGALTQAQSRGLWLSDDAANALENTDGFPPTAKCSLTFRASNLTGPTNIAVDANVDGGGHPTLVVSAGSSAGGAWTAYLDVAIPEAIGD